MLNVRLLSFRPGIEGMQPKMIKETRECCNYSMSSTPPLTNYGMSSTPPPTNDSMPSTPLLGKFIKTTILSVRNDYSVPNLYRNTVVSNHFHSVKNFLFSSAKPRAVDGMLGTGLPVSMYTTKTPINKCRFNITQL